MAQTGTLVMLQLHSSYIRKVVITVLYIRKEVLHSLYIRKEVITFFICKEISIIFLIYYERGNYILYTLGKK